MLFRYIRANQGHSIPVELDLKAANVDVAYHGKRDRENVEYNVLKGRQMTHGKSSNTKD
jgi:RNA:NAD 2'-phosphotransferase (TPT1/KptA family)